MPAAYLKATILFRPEPCRKIRFESRKQALIAYQKSQNTMIKADRTIVEAGQGRMNVYKCSFCGMWHLGHR